MFAGGDLPARLPADLEDVDDGAFVACADRGLEHCLALGRTPDLIVGDFDSVPAALLDSPACRGATRVTLPADKDASDLDVALERLAAEPGIDRACLLGVSGGRTDHLLFNWLLAARDWPFALRLVDDEVDARAVRPGRPARIDAPAGATLSLLAPVPARGVTTRGLRWELEDAALGPGSTRGLSNQVRGPGPVEVRVAEGALLAMLVRGSPSPSPFRARTGAMPR